MRAGWITPDWPAPPNVRALSTTRDGGVSEGSFGSFNLGAHVGDTPSSVKRNRESLAALLPAEPLWLEQVLALRWRSAVGILRASGRTRRLLGSLGWCAPS